ncbi:MAG: hypothetical protein RSC76_00045 [Oscillospiraceae bacterium]
MAKHDIIFEVKGLKNLAKALKKNITLNDVRRVVRRNGSQLQTKIQNNADFKGHYGWKKGEGRVFENATGATKESVRLELENGGLTAVSGPETEYSPYVEQGTRFMEAQPFVKPAFDDQKGKFTADMKKLVR